MDEIVRYEYQSELWKEVDKSLPEGNYFVMDNEQLFSNPLNEMQTEAMSDFQKKASLTEKLTSVKNNVCDHRYHMIEHQLEKEKSSKMRVLHDVSSKLRYEAKLLDIEQRKHDMEVKRRIEPQKDFTYDQNQLSQTEKRLGIITQSHYLGKKLNYPIRQCSVNNLVPPTVSKARESLQRQNSSKVSSERPQSGGVGTPKTIYSSTTETTQSNVHHQVKRPGSKSAVSRSSTRYDGEDKGFKDKLPVLGDNTFFVKSKKNSNLSPHVKFSEGKENNSTGQLVLPRQNFQRAHTYHSSMGKSYPVSSESSYTEATSSSLTLSEKLELREILLRKSNKWHNGTPRSMSHSVPKAVTQEMLKKESKHLRQKIDRFLNTIPMEQKQSNEFIDDMSLPSFNKSTEHQTQNDTAYSSVDGSKSDDDDTETMQNKPKRDLWKLIRGKATNMKVGHQTPMDLMLQYMTGMIVDSKTRKTSAIPLNSASRAMRHTATFKMQKIVEKMIEDRTRYKQHEVDVLKQKLESGELPNIITADSEGNAIADVSKANAQMV